MKAKRQFAYHDRCGDWCPCIVTYILPQEAARHWIEHRDLVICGFISDRVMYRLRDFDALEDASAIGVVVVPTSTDETRVLSGPLWSRFPPMPGELDDDARVYLVMFLP